MLLVVAEGCARRVIEAGFDSTGALIVRRGVEGCVRVQGEYKYLGHPRTKTL